MAKKKLIIDKKNITSLLTKLAREMIVLAPVRKKDVVLFKQITKGEEVTLDFTNTHLSVKSALFPQCEKMMTFTTNPEADNAQIMKDVDPQQKKQVIFGIRPCDAKSFVILDSVFNQSGTAFKDPYFIRHREKTTVVGIGCTRPLSSCFCTSFDTEGPFSKDGLDVLLIDIGDKYVADVLTNKGEEFLKDIKVSGADAASIKKAQQISEDAKKLVSSHVYTNKIKDKDIRKLFDDLPWDIYSETCIGCGVCTYSCPTCHCFDIQDEVLGTEGIRIRNWDSCMFPIYTQQAAGHNPRPTKKERFRQRFMHKFKYFQDTFNMTSCVGCGRCIQSCPVNIDIRQIIQEMNK